MLFSTLRWGAACAGLMTLIGCGGSGGATATTGAGGAGSSSTGGPGGSSASTSTSSTSSGETSSSSGTGGANPGTSGQWVLGYYVGYSINAYPIASIDWSGLTHIAFAPLLVKQDLSLDFSFYDQNGTGQQDAVAISTAAHAHGVKAMLMLGGAGAGATIATAASDANRPAFVAALIDALSTLGYDGIDLDWEDYVDTDDLVSLAQDLRAAKPSIVLSYPAGSINGNFQTVDPRMAKLAQALDRFNVQSYYPTTAVAGQGWDSWFNSPLSGVMGSTPVAIDDTLQRYADAGVPKSKLGMGMSFYAICYTSDISGPRQPTSGNTQIIGGDNAYPLSAFFASGSTFDKSKASEQQRDAVAQVPYLSLAAVVSDKGCGGPTRYISYDDEVSILAKGAFSRAKGYGGIIVWTIQEGWLPQGASGGRAQNALMQALKKGFIDP